jgi:1-deoxy-D-xylulose-5-phosphate reductoisomerase
MGIPAFSGPAPGLGGAGAPAGTTAVLNAANEVAVAQFLERRIRFDQIHALNLETLSSVPVSKPGSLDDLLALDRSPCQRAAHCAAAGLTERSTTPGCPC